MNKLFLAPHHDDVLLSLSGSLLDRESLGEAHVAVIFSEESDELAVTCTRLHRALGLGLHCLGFAEALRRGMTLRASFRTARTIQQVRDDVLFETVRMRLEELITELKPDVIYSPLLPIQLDHALARAAAEGLGAVTLRYYEDQPYASLHPRVLAREQGGLLPLEEISRAHSREVEVLLGELTSVVPAQHLSRILANCREVGDPPTHLVWQRPITLLNQL